MKSPPISYPSRAAVIEDLHARYAELFKLRQGAPKDITALLFRELETHERAPQPRKPRGFTLNELIDASKDRKGKHPDMRPTQDALRALGRNLGRFGAVLDFEPVQIAGFAYVVHLVGPTATERGDADHERYWIDGRFRAPREESTTSSPVSIEHDARLNALETLVLGLIEDAGRTELRDRARELFDDARGGASLDRYVDEEMTKLLKDVEESISVEKLTPKHRLALRNAMFRAEEEYLEIVQAAHEKVGEEAMKRLSVLERTRIQKLLSTERREAWVIIFALAVVWAWELGGEKRESFSSLVRDLRDRLPERVASAYFQRILDAVRSSLGDAPSEAATPDVAETGKP